MKRVGILLRSDETYHLNKELVDWLGEYNIVTIGIVSNNFNSMIEITKLCDGIILQGGSDYTPLEIEYVKYLYEHNIPVLGICLGMQMMALATGGSLGTLEESIHKSKKRYVHKITIVENSKLYEIVKSEIIDVNSRHKDYVKFTKLNVSAISNDGIIEAIEGGKNKFFIGVQWHPETIKDIYSTQLLESFINIL